MGKVDYASIRDKFITYAEKNDNLFARFNFF